MSFGGGTKGVGVTVVTDSTCDLDEDMVRRYGIEVVSLSVGFGDQYYRDRIELSAEAFMHRLVTSQEPAHTAAPSPGAFATLYRDILARPDCDAIISIHLSGGLSSTARVAESAARLVDGNITVIDSQNVSVGLGILVLWAARRAVQGTAASMVTNELQALIPNVHLVLAPVTLEYLARGGRIGQAARLVGTLLDMKPILEVDHGMIKAAKKVRGDRHITPGILQVLGERVPHGTPCLIAAASTTPVPQVETLMTALTANYPPVASLRAVAGPVIGTHAGPGAYGAVLCPLTADQVQLWQRTDT